MLKSKKLSILVFSTSGHTVYRVGNQCLTYRATQVDSVEIKTGRNGAKSQYLFPIMSAEWGFFWVIVKLCETM